MNSTICNAIKGKQLIELHYHGYFRLVEPYAYGRDKSGEDILRCFQEAGGSESGESRGWKLLKVNEIRSINPQERQFSIRSEYRRNDKAMNYIYCEV